jgi:hypothetical protein
MNKLQNGSMEAMEKVLEGLVKKGPVAVLHLKGPVLIQAGK